MGQHSSKQFCPDLPQPRRPFSEVRSRPSEREERRTTHFEFRVHHDAAEPQRQHERRFRRQRGSVGNQVPLHTSRGRTEKSKSVLPEAKSSVDKPASTQASRRSNHGHDRTHRHRSHNDAPQYDHRKLIQPRDSVHTSSEFPPLDYSAPAEVPHPTKQCPICATTRSISRFPTRSPTSVCKHEASVCRRCLRRWLEAQFETKPWNELKCPICPSVLLHGDVKAFASRDMFKKYEREMTKAEYESISGWTWCEAKQCLAGQVHDGHKAKFRCNTCGHEQCTKCGVKWHSRQTCKDYQKRIRRGAHRRAQDSASEDLIASTTKPCPSCSRAIEKVDGCDHMTCVKCKHQFCWQCLAGYTSKKQVLRIQHVPGCLSMY